MSGYDGAERPVRTPKPRPAPLLPPQRSASASAKVRVDDRKTADVQAGSYGTFDNRGRYGAAIQSPSKRMNFFEYMASPHSPIVQVRSHCQQQWVAILLTIALLGFTLYFVLGTSAPPVGVDCATPFGTYLGESNGVVAFSNCNRRFFGNNMDHYVRVGLKRIATGAKWRSIEYVRRYWILTRQLVLPPVSTSEKLMELQQVHMMSKNLRDVIVPLERFYNLAKPLAEVSQDSQDDQQQQQQQRQRGDEDESATSRKARVDSTAADQSHKEKGADDDKVNANGVPLAAWVVDRQRALPQEGDIVVYAVEKPNMTHGHAAVVVHVGGPFRRVEEMSPRMQAYLKSSLSTAESDLDSPTERVHAWSVPLDALRKEQHDLARASVTATSKKLGTQAGSLLYQVFIAEQNSDNWYWADELTDKDAAQLEKRSSKDANEASMFTSAFKVGVPHRASPDSNKTHSSTDALYIRRSFSRVLLLREYYPSHAYYIEDTFGDRIMGWIRPQNMTS